MRKVWVLCGPSCVAWQAEMDLITGNRKEWLAPFIYFLESGPLASDYSRIYK